MKRVFAFISLFAISLVMFGFGTANVKAAGEPAEGKWVVNPYLLEDENGEVVEIPMYIMDSIATTFPFHYDRDAQADENWGGIARQYAWNGVKTVIPQFNANGATGQYYGVYQQGASSGSETGIGKMIYTTEGLWDNGTFYNSGDLGGSYIRTSPHDPSLSFSLHNTKDEAVGIQVYKEASNQIANPFIIFDAEGKAVAGLIHSSAVAANGLGTEFCYDADGVGVVANADASNCAKVMVDTEEDDLDKPIKDEDGNIIGYEKVQVEGDDPQYITTRFAWAYLGAAPANLNNSYLGEGWKADNWDFYNEATGVAVVILGSGIANGGAVSAAELAADDSVEAGHVRAPYYEITIPAGGFFYQFGYLDRNSTLLPTYKDVEAQAYLYGRNEGYKMYFKCYNYAGADITFKEGAQNGYGLSKIPGTNTIEAIAGESIKLADLVDYAALATCFADENDPFSFQSSVLTDSDFEAKLKEFIEAEKAILREEPAYSVYQEWLDSQAEEEAKLVKAVEDAKAALDAAMAKKEALEDAAEKAILASEDEKVVDAYNALLDAIEAAKKAIDDKKDEIADLEDAVKDIEAELADAETAYKDTLQYKGYAQSLSDAYANHVKELTYLMSFVALGLGCADDLTTTDVTAEYKQDAKYENWTVTFKNSDIEAAKAALVAAIAADDEAAVEAAKAAFVESFQIDEENEFADDYKKVVVKYVDNFEKLEIANTAISSYIATFLSKIGDPTVPTGLYKELADAKAAVEAANAELGAPASKDKDGKDVPSTGLYAELDDAEADRIAYIDEFLAGNTDYQVAKENVATAEAAVEAAEKALEAYYVEYKATYEEVELKIAETAADRAKPKYEEWLATEYKWNVALDFEVVVDGARVVYKSDYTSADKAKLQADFLADWAVWAEAHGVAKDNDEYNLFSFFNNINGDYFRDEAFLAEWSWLVQYVCDNTNSKDNKGPLENILKKTTGWYNYNRASAEIVLFFAELSGVDYRAQLTEDQKAAIVTADTSYILGEGSTSFANEDVATGWAPAPYDEYMLNISDVVNAKTNVTVTIKSPISGASSSMDLVFVSAGNVYDYTPIIEVNKGALVVNDVESFDIKSIATAYDKIWSETNGIKGNDISEQIAFFAPELEAALAANKCGEYEVIMTVTSGTARKTATASAIVKIVDTIAPVVQVRDVYLNYGDDFHFLDGVYFAYDNVDGNLFDAEKFLFSANESVNTYEAGEYTVEISAMDLSGNQSKVVEYVVYVNEAPSNDDVIDAIEKAETAIKDNDKTLNDATNDKIGNVDTELDGVADDAAGANAGANDNTLAVVVTIIASVAAVASIAAVVLVIIKK
jgi:predicted RNA-binding protein with TRAM domain